MKPKTKSACLAFVTFTEIILLAISHFDSASPVMVPELLVTPFTLITLIIVVFTIFDDQSASPVVIPELAIALVAFVS